MRYYSFLQLQGYVDPLAMQRAAVASICAARFMHHSETLAVMTFDDFNRSLAACGVGDPFIGPWQTPLHSVLPQATHCDH